MRLTVLAGVVSLAALAAPAVPAAGLQAGRPLAVGDPAPSFSLAGSDGRTYTLADYRGKQAVVLAWFARPFSGG